MVTRGHSALLVHSVPGGDINSLNERGTVSDCPVQVDNKHFITSLSLRKRKKILCSAFSVL